MEVVIDFLFLGSKIIAECDCSYEIKRLFLWKDMTNLDSIWKNRDITLLTKLWFFQSKLESRLVRVMVFPVVMNGCESWTIKKDECWRIDAFELWCWRRFLRVPLTVRRSNHSVLKEMNPEYTLDGLMLKLQSFGHLMWRAAHWKRPWCWKRFKVKGKGGSRWWDAYIALST